MIIHNKYNKKIKNFFLKLELKNIKKFTLLELIIVIVVIGILVGMALPKFLGVQRNAKVASMERDLDTLEKAVQLYVTNTNNGSYPFKDLNDDNIINEEDLYYKTNPVPQTLKDVLLKSNGDDGSKIYQLDINKLEPYIQKLKYNDIEYLYSQKSETAIDPIGKIDGKNITHYIIGNGKIENIKNLRNWKFTNNIDNDIDYILEELKDMPKGNIKIIDKNLNLESKEYKPSFNFSFLGKTIDTLKISNDGKIKFLDVYREKDNNFISLIGDINNNDNFNFISTKEYLTADINIELKQDLIEIPLDSNFIFKELNFNSIKIIGPNICLGNVNMNTMSWDAYIFGVEPLNYSQSENAKILYKKGIENNQKYIIVEFKDYFYLNYSFKLYENGELVFYFNDTQYKNFIMIDGKNNEMITLFDKKIINNSSLYIKETINNKVTIGDVYLKEDTDKLNGMHFDEKEQTYINGNYDCKYILVEYRDVLYNDIEKSDFAIKIYEDGTYKFYFNNDKTFLNGKVINTHNSNYSVFIETLLNGSGVIQYTNIFPI